MRKLMRKLVTLLILLSAVLTASATETNYFCIVCGQGPLTGHLWLHPRGAICDACEKLPDRCSICGLPVKNGDGHIKTPDGRLICRFDKPSVILTADQARDLFGKTRDDVVDLYGRQFALKFPEVTVNLFDVDYWSEKGNANGLHKFGFAHTRKSGDGVHTHEVVMLSGRTREEMTAVAAHEYTHLWIWENCPESHQIDDDTVEAICELTAYKLMQEKKDAEMQKRILENPYTNGKIRDVVAVEREGGTDYVLNWVKNSRAGSFDTSASLAPLPAAAAQVIPVALAPRVLPQGLTFSGIMAFGKAQSAVINGEEFAAGDQKTLNLRDRSLLVRCVAVNTEEVTVEANGRSLTLERGQEQAIP
ncbi:MAG: hypothetical protein ABSH48_20485 [Verrucomicrobiota bacterium]